MTMTDTAATPATSTTATETPSTVTTATTIKPGWQTTEFYFALAAKILSGLFAFGLVGDGSTLSRLAGVAGFVLTQMGYTVSRTLIKTAAMYAIVIFAFHSTGCGGASSQEKALMATTATLNAAEVTFVSWDGKHQLDLVAACDPTAGKTACDLTLNAYRKQRDKTVAAITASYKAVDAAWTAVNDKTVATAIAAAVAVQQALAALGVK